MSELVKPVIYALTAVSMKRRSHRTRCWGWWPTEREAIAALEQEPDAFLENGYYDLVVIEEVPAGVSWNVRAVWFETVVERDAEGRQVSCQVRRLSQTPAEYEGTMGWSMG
jgi:hypothetical protein